MYGVVIGPLAGNVADFASGNPWIIGLGVLAVVVFAIYYLSKRSPQTAEAPGLDPRGTDSLDSTVEDAEELLTQARYRKAMKLLEEDSKRGVAEPMNRALAYLTHRGVERGAAALNLTRIISLKQAMHARGD